MQISIKNLLKKCLKLYKGDIVLVKGEVEPVVRDVLRELSAQTGVFFIIGDSDAVTFERLDDISLARMGYKRLAHSSTKKK